MVGKNKKDKIINKFIWHGWEDGVCGCFSLSSDNKIKMKLECLDKIIEDLSKKIKDKKTNT